MITMCFTGMFVVCLFVVMVIVTVSCFCFLLLLCVHASMPSGNDGHFMDMMWRVFRLFYLQLSLYIMRSACAVFFQVFEPSFINKHPNIYTTHILAQPVETFYF